MDAQQLRASILQMAIEGKLVPQNSDEPPVDINAKDVVPAEEHPFEIPENWRWAHFSSVITLISGRDLSSQQILDAGKVPYITGASQISAERLVLSRWTNDAVCISELNDVLLVCKGSGVGKIALNTCGVVHIARQIMALRAKPKIIQISFLLLCTKYFAKYFAMDAQGVIPGISRKDVLTKLLPLPPLAEQKRIVAKIEELMPLVDDYGKAQEHLAQLDKDLPSKLKRSVLQAAIQGKLVPQINDEKPADIDVKDVVSEDERPFEIPDNWRWVRLADVCKYIQRGKSPKYSDVEKYPVIAQKCNQWDGFHIEKAKFIDPSTLDKYLPERLLKDFDVLLNSTGLGTLGRVAVYRDNLNPYGFAVADSHVTVIRSNSSKLNAMFLYRYLCSPAIQDSIESWAGGSTKQKELGQATVRGLVIPLPPLAEQKRIVAKIEELFAIIDGI